MSKAQELADKLDKFLNQEARDAAAELRRLDRVNAEMVESLSQITSVYEAIRSQLAEKYPQDGWSSETMTIDRARAALSSTGGNES